MYLHNTDIMYHVCHLYAIPMRHKSIEHNFTHEAFSLNIKICFVYRTLVS